MERYQGSSVVIVENLIAVLLDFTLKMEVAAESGEWDRVRELDEQRQMVLSQAIGSGRVKTDNESMRRIEIVQEKILSLARKERQSIAQDYEQDIERLQNCQSYLDTDRQSALKG